MNFSTYDQCFLFSPAPPLYSHHVRGVDFHLFGGYLRGNFLQVEGVTRRVIDLVDKAPSLPVQLQSLAAPQSYSGRHPCHSQSNQAQVPFGQQVRIGEQIDWRQVAHHAHPCGKELTGH
ncbi:MAG: hypothetical protein SPK34_04470 [Bacteroidaceae bacterium]|nr:hypothetical protein [Prevotellaceae bacterium]MDD6015068.1 hypothetical protein [Prevotellaceae bacterium]MDD7526300.1 hypothetical protein [Prevotellaceae bacterium]MDY5760168.1 hypothetical protein [Bacteroidaceae bacterium]